VRTPVAGGSRHDRVVGGHAAGTRADAPGQRDTSLHGGAGVKEQPREEREEADIAEGDAGEVEGDLPGPETKGLLSTRVPIQKGHKEKI
jgi:hypothetical protein